MTENQIGTAVVELAIAVHQELGPGLYESVYETVLAYEMEFHGLAVSRQVPVPIRYKHLEFQEGFKADIIVNDKVILKSSPLRPLQSLIRNKCSPIFG